LSASPTRFFTILISQELLEFVIPILEKHKQLWAKDIEYTISMLMTKHGTRMSEFARDVMTASKDHTTPSPSFASPPRVANVSNLQQPPGSASKATPETQFWNEAIQIAEEVERSKEKSTRQNHIAETFQAPTSAETIHDQGATSPTYYDIESPSFSLFGPCEGLSQPQSPPPDHVQEADADTNGAGTTSSGIYSMFTQLAFSLMYVTDLITRIVQSGPIAQSPSHELDHVA
jgi:hypothetical protein